MTRISDQWDRDWDCLVHYERHSHVPDYCDPRDPAYCRHQTDVVHHGCDDAPSVLALCRADAEPEAVAAEIRRLAFGAQPVPARWIAPAPVVVLPNGREVREVAGGYEVQPPLDSYWVRCETLDGAVAVGTGAAK